MVRFCSRIIISYVSDASYEYNMLNSLTSNRILINKIDFVHREPL